MADLRVITILPTQPVSGVQQSQLSAGQSLLAGISNLQAGSILSGFIINRDVNGNPVLRTDSGDITFASNFFLKIGSEITIRIEHIAGNNSAHILSVNGNPPEIAVTQSAFSQEPEVIVSENLRPATTAPAMQSSGNPAINASAATAAQPSPLPTPAITVTGTVISPAPMPAGQENAGATLLPAGSQLSLKIISLAVAQAPPAPAGDNIPKNTSNADTSNIPKAANTATATVTGNAANNFPAPQASNPYSAYINTLTATTASITPQEIPVPPASGQGQPVSPMQAVAGGPTPPPVLPLPATEAPQAGQQINASVISNSPSGESIIHTPVGILRLQEGVQLPVGSQVTFEIKQIQTQETLERGDKPAIAPGLAASPAPLTQLARSPGALTDIFSLLSGLSSPDAQNFISKNLPSIGQAQAGASAPNQQPQPQNLLSSLLTFSSAVRSGDFREWLGRGNVKWLEDNGHENLLKKAEGEFLTIARQFVDVPAGQWQSLFFPIAIAGELQQTRLFVKRDRRQKESDGRPADEEDTRFVLEMDLSQLGEMQMDGFVKRNDLSIQFDLVIRSHIPLARDIQQEIIQIYTDVGELTGYKGSIAFQSVRDFPVNPMEDIISIQHESVVA
jgi:hypothetical protein